MLSTSPCDEHGKRNPVSASKTTAQTLPAVSTKYPRLHPEDRCDDLLNHPAFRGFSHRMLPWDGQHYDLAVPLKEIGQLLPYHSHVEPAIVIAALNRMVDDASAGRPVLYEFYTAAQRQAQPALKNTGLFFSEASPAPLSLSLHRGAGSPT